jgi:uncharacterized membrane protein YfcA
MMTAECFIQESLIMEFLFIFSTFLIAGVTLAVTGFGHALLAMPLLAPVIGLETASPMMALVSLSLEAIMLLRYRQQFNFPAVWRLVAGSLVAIPIGMALLHVLDKRVMLTALGVVAAGYGAYSLFRFPLPEIRRPAWGFGFGFISGLLSGAYNTGGPPVVIYGTMSGWQPINFKSNLQSMFILNSLLIVGAHLLQGHMTQAVGTDYLAAMPGALLGLWIGWRLDKRVAPERFRQLVLVMLIALGLRLIFA